MSNMSELNFFLFITNIFVILLCGALLPLMPFFTRKSFLFGVKVPPSAQQTDEAKALKRRYVLVTALGGAAMLAVCVWQYLTVPHVTLLAVLYMPFLLIAIEFAVYVPNHRKALELKRSRGWVASEKVFADTKTSFTRGRLSSMPQFWYVISMLLVFASFAIILAKYPSLPEQIPTHWNIRMEPDAWATKSIPAALSMPLIGLGMVVLLWLVGVLIEKAKLQIDFGEPAKSFAQHKKYRHLMGHSVGIAAVGAALMFLLIACQTAIPDFAVPMPVDIGISLLAFVPMVIVGIRSGQGGTLLKVSAKEMKAVGAATATSFADEADARAADKSDDAHWALGLFYHNPDDPACFVGNRFGYNIGFNYSRLSVKIGVAILVAVLAICYVWMTVKFAAMM
jgi:uncharacterized membrane protein